MRRLALLAPLCLLLSMGCIGSVAAEGQGVIEGQAMNGTAGAGPESVAGLEVVLYLVTGEAQELIASATTDVGGRFRFDGLDTDSQCIYRFRLEYQGIVYSGESAFPPGETVLPIVATVHDSTTSADAIRVDRHHVIIDFAPGALAIQEMYIFDNTGDRIYVGEEGATLRFALPPEATDLAFGDPHLEINTVQTGEGFASLLPVTPGQTQMLYSYRVPYDGANLSLVRMIVYPTANLDVMVADVGVRAQSEQLEYGGLTGGKDTSYLRFEAKDLSPGQEIELHLSGASQEAVPPASSGPSARLGLQQAAPFIALALVLVGAVLPFAQVHLQGRASGSEGGGRPKGPILPGDEAGLSARRGELLHLIADLDYAFEQGLLGQEAYEQLRGRMKKRLRETWDS